MNYVTLSSIYNHLIFVKTSQSSLAISPQLVGSALEKYYTANRMRVASTLFHPILLAFSDVEQKGRENLYYCCRFADLIVELFDRQLFPVVDVLLLLYLHFSASQLLRRCCKKYYTAYTLRVPSVRQAIVPASFCADEQKVIQSMLYLVRLILVFFSMHRLINQAVCRFYRCLRFYFVGVLALQERVKKFL